MGAKIRGLLAGHYAGSRPTAADHETKKSAAQIVILKLLGKFGGPGRDRTDDLFHAMEARSQLRHRPIVLRGQLLDFNSRLGSSPRQTRLQSPPRIGYV